MRRCSINPREWVDGNGNVYVADTYNHTIRKITPWGAVTTLAGWPSLSGSADGIGSAARFWSSYGVAVDSSGNIYVADTRNHAIRKGVPAIDAHAAIDTASGPIGTTRLLGSAPKTATAVGMDAHSASSRFCGRTLIHGHGEPNVHA